MTSQLKFGKYVVRMTGARRNRKVTFYDYSPEFPHGHMVSRYYASTLATGSVGLCLEGSDPDRWTISETHMKIVRKWINAKSRYKVTPHKGYAYCDYRFPTEAEVLQQFLVQTQGPLCDVTTNEDGEISSKTVTDWYVKKYCEMNHLKV